MYIGRIKDSADLKGWYLSKVWTFGQTQCYSTLFATGEARKHFIGIREATPQLGLLPYPGQN